MSSGLKTPRRRRLISDKTLEIPPSPGLKKLGFGTGVKVMLYERSPRMGVVRSPWAIKKLNKNQTRGDIANRLEHEAKTLQELKHPNIIGFRSYKKNEDGSRLLAIENGEHSLFDIIEEIREHQMDDSSDDIADIGLKPLPAENILKVIKSVASALDYLHNEKRLLHGDLKSANILVAGTFDSVKVCDFGVSIPVNKDGVADDPNHQYIGTEPWAAMEVIKDGTISTKTDIFALGCVIFEMLALDTPHGDKLPLEEDDGLEEDTFDDSEYQEALGKRPELPDNIQLDDSYDDILSLFYACTMENPAKRPSAKLILETVKNVCI